MTFFQASPIAHKLQTIAGCYTILESLLWLNSLGQAQWLMPVIPARWEDHKVRRSRPSWLTRWNLISTKNTKSSWAWWHTPIIPAPQKAEAGESAWTQEVEVAMSQPRATVLQPRQQNESPSQKTKEKRKIISVSATCSQNVHTNICAIFIALIF